MSINPQALAESWPWMSAISSVAEFDTAFAEYLSPEGQVCAALLEVWLLLTLPYRLVCAAEARA